MITYLEGTKNIDWTKLTDLYEAVDGVIGLGKARNTERIKQSFIQSYKVITAWDGNTIVGGGRMISDGYCYAWIHDIGVLPSYQKMGIGKAIMDHLMDEPEPLLFGLTSSFAGIRFYDSLGFKKHKTAMCKYPGPSTYLEENNDSLLK